MPARAVDAEGLTALLHVGDQVLPAEREALLGRGRREVHAVVEQRARLAEDPRMLDGATPHHDARAARLVDRALARPPRCARPR